MVDVKWDEGEDGKENKLNDSGEMHEGKNQGRRVKTNQGRRVKTGLNVNVSSMGIRRYL